MIRCFAIALSCCILAACSTRKIAQEASNGKLIFQSGFEPGSHLLQNSNESVDIYGRDSSVSDHNEWTADLDNDANIGSFSIQYGVGDTLKRKADIIPEPGNPVNHVLRFWLKEPTLNAGNGRIQANIYGNNNLREFYQRERMFLSPEFNEVKKYPKTIHWLTIAEFWNNITWSQTVPYRFRITLGLGKQTEEEDNLHFILDAEDCQLFADDTQKYTTVWAEVNKDVAVPIGQWFTMEYYFREGDNNSGRFYMAITPASGKKRVIFDVHKITHNTVDPHPDGVGDFNPMKLYTSRDLVEFMNGRGKVLQIYWDDFRLWKDKRPE